MEDSEVFAFLEDGIGMRFGADIVTGEKWEGALNNTRKDKMLGKQVTVGLLFSYCFAEATVLAILSFRALFRIFMKLEFWEMRYHRNVSSSSEIHLASSWSKPGLFADCYKSSGYHKFRFLHWWCSHCPCRFQLTFYKILWYSELGKLAKLLWLLSFFWVTPGVMCLLSASMELREAHLLASTVLSVCFLLLPALLHTVELILSRHKSHST